jgi:hypothetical protein
MEVAMGVFGTYPEGAWIASGLAVIHQQQPS